MLFWGKKKEKKRKIHTLIFCLVTEEFNFLIFLSTPFFTLGFPHSKQKVIVQFPSVSLSS